MKSLISMKTFQLYSLLLIKCKEMNAKFSLYEENGVKEYWIIDPESFVVNVFELINDKFVFRLLYEKEDLIPVGIFEGFSINSGKIFR